MKQFYTKLNKAIDKYQNLCIKQRTFSLAGCAEEFRKADVLVFPGIFRFSVESVDTISRV